MSGRSQTHDRGPFRASQLHSGDPYELSHGHAIRCLPTGGRGAGASGTGFSVLSSDPAVDAAGIDVGYSPQPDTLRAPDIAVGNVPEEPGWVPGVPPLAVEYADTGQDEADLTAKIAELLDAGTRYIWVVRLAGPRRVEVHVPGQEMTIARPGEELTAPGVLRNPILVEALYDREAGQRATLRNLLQREGYESLDAVRAEGETRGELSALRAAVLEVLDERCLAVDERSRRRVEASGDPTSLRRWLRRSATASSVEDALRD